MFASHFKKENKIPTRKKRLVVGNIFFAGPHLPTNNVEQNFHWAVLSACLNL